MHAINLATDDAAELILNYHCHESKQLYQFHDHSNGETMAGKEENKIGFHLMTNGA